MKEKTKLSAVVSIYLSFILMLAMGCGEAPVNNEEYAEQAVESETDEITIGRQIWQTADLSVSTFRNGDTIDMAMTPDDWQRLAAAQKPACFNTPAGLLYNWYAVNDKRGLAPQGWHVPANNEWKELKVFLGDSCDEQLKSSLSWNGDDRWGFSVIPGGYLNEKGVLIDSSGSSCFWTTTAFDTEKAWSRIFVTDKVARKRTVPVFPKSFGMAVRCIKDEQATADNYPSPPATE